MKIFLIFLLGAQMALSAGPNASPQEGLQKLIDGNQRYVNGKLLHVRRDQERRNQTALKQKPFAVILGCSDSRVAPEILFDQGLGDLFVVRVAGNIVGPTELASIKYATLQLDSGVVFVLGHENCGAISAVIEGKTEGIEPIAKLIEPAVKDAKLQEGTTLKNAVIDNVKNVTKQLRQEPSLKNLIDSRKLIVVGGYYDLLSGNIKMLPSKPTTLPVAK